MIAAVNTARFQTEVIEASRQQPVVVDFWAAWCGPCRALAPILERVAPDYAGRATVVKLNTDEEPGIAQMFGIRSLPTVAVFKDGKIVDGFMGVQPESVIRETLDRHVAGGQAAAREAALSRAAHGDFITALGTLRELVRAGGGTPHKEDVLALVDVLLMPPLALAAVDEAATHLERLPFSARESQGALERAAKIRFARIALRTAPAGTAESLESEAANHLLAGRHQDALDAFLLLLQHHPRHASESGEAAGRRGLVDAFLVLGEEHELVPRYRRRMAAALH
ncbi:MAG: thioredoxin [Gammaproteobacteria bacterium]